MPKVGQMAVLENVGFDESADLLRVFPVQETLGQLVRKTDTVAITVEDAATVV